MIEPTPYIAHNGKLYQDFKFMSWSKCGEIQGVSKTELYPEALKAQRDKDVVIHRLGPVLPIRLDFNTY